MKPVAWIYQHPDTLQPALKFAEPTTYWATVISTPDIPLYTHPVKPAICVGYWDNKTGAFHKHLTESQQKRVDEGFLQPVYTAGMLPVKELTDEEITEMAKRKANQILMDLLMPDVGNERRIDWNVGCTREHLKNFAKAILRKAQEK